MAIKNQKTQKTQKTKSINKVIRGYIISRIKELSKPKLRTEYEYTEMISRIQELENLSSYFEDWENNVNKKNTETLQESEKKS